MTEDTNALDTARAYLDSISDLLDAHEAAPTDATLAAIEELPLETSVRCTSWSTRYDDLLADEYRILLCTGGPAVQITGDYDPDDGPVNAHIQYQDWFRPWRAMPSTTEQDHALLRFANMIVGH